MAKSITKPSINAHIKRVMARLEILGRILYARGLQHDSSKLSPSEITGWQSMDEEPRYPYGSREYYSKLNKYSYVLAEHYRNNSHHPEFYSCNLSRMDLLDLTEMLCDWLGYAEKPTPFEIIEKVDTQKGRFNMSDELASILSNTAIRYLSSESIKGIAMKHEDLVREDILSSNLSVDEYVLLVNTESFNPHYIEP